MKYYAVKFGKVPGVYESLKKANKQVIGVSGAKMKLFLLPQIGTFMLLRMAMLLGFSNQNSITKAK